MIRRSNSLKLTEIEAFHFLIDAEKVGLSLVRNGALRDFKIEVHEDELGFYFVSYVLPFTVVPKIDLASLEKVKHGTIARDF